jgi:hypothetical protein
LAQPSPQQARSLAQAVFPLAAQTQSWPTQSGAAAVVQSPLPQQTPSSHEPAQHTSPALAATQSLLAAHAAQAPCAQIGVGLAQLPASQAQRPSAWHTWPVLPQASSTCSGSGTHAPGVLGPL